MYTHISRGRKPPMIIEQENERIPRCIDRQIDFWMGMERTKIGRESEVEYD